MGDIHNKLATILASAQGTGNFYVNARPELIPPSLAIDGIGRISFPLLAEQAKQIIAIATRFPFGRGEDTTSRLRARALHHP